MKPCGECGLEFPEEILSQMCVNGGYTEPICGICALKISNEIHDRCLPRSKFDGPLAEHWRQEALRINRARG